MICGKELLQIKLMLATFFAQRLSNFVNQAIITQGITEQDLDSWLNTEAK